MNYYNLIADTQAKLNASLLNALYDSGKLVARGSKRMRLSHVGRRQQPVCSRVLSGHRYPLQPRRSTHGTDTYLPELHSFEKRCQRQRTGVAVYSVSGGLVRRLKGTADAPLRLLPPQPPCVRGKA
jgi:hypothetical protein